MKKFALLRLFQLGALMVLITTPANAFGNDDYWVSGWGMGTKEAIITNGPGNQIYVACEEGSLYPSSISFVLRGDSSKDDRVFLTFDDEDPVDIWISDGMIKSDCRACAANFSYVIERLKRHRSVFVQFLNGDGSRFTLKGSSAAIGQCIPGFNR